MKDYPTNKEEYWKIVDTHWEDLYNILARFLPKEKLINADRLRLQQDSKLVDLFNDSWWNAPDSPNIHGIPSWRTLCNLCSEAHVLFDGESESE